MPGVPVDFTFRTRVEHRPAEAVREAAPGS
jgi:hypothetical protein